MKSIKFSLIIISSLFIFACAGTQTKQEETVHTYSVQGWGGTSCEQLIHDITPKKVGFNQAVQNIKSYQAWVSGFVSGVNYASDDAFDVSGSTDPEESFTWLKSYCEEHHEVTVPQALHELLEIWEKEGKVISESSS